GKTPQVMITAVSRELSGFLWAAMNRECRLDCVNDLWINQK
ncbi:IS110 family transposase, partial [Leptospira mayottensis]